MPTSNIAIKFPTEEAACLVLVYPPGPDLGRRFPLAPGDNLLGRRADCQVQVERASISRHHARVCRSEHAWSLEDLESENGSYVNDVPIATSPLRNGDLVQISDVMFRFLAGTDLEASYHHERSRLEITDGLTGAYNERYLFELLDPEIRRCARLRRPLSLLVFDIDHFRSFNDEHGHLAGDHVLRALARHLFGRLPPDSTLARCGGDELAVVLPALDLVGARSCSEWLCLGGSATVQVPGSRFTIRVSAGAACLEGAAPEGAAVEGAAVEGAALNGAAIDGAVIDGAAVEGAVINGQQLVELARQDLARARREAREPSAR